MATNKVSHPAPTTLSAVADDTMVGPHDATELRDVDVQHIPRSFVLVARHRLEVAELILDNPACASTRLTVDSPTPTARDARLQQVPMPQLHDYRSGPCNLECSSQDDSWRDDSSSKRSNSNSALAGEIERGDLTAREDASSSTDSAPAR